MKADGTVSCKSKQHYQHNRQGNQNALGRLASTTWVVHQHPMQSWNAYRDMTDLRKNEPSRFTSATCFLNTHGISCIPSLPTHLQTLPGASPTPLTHCIKSVSGFAGASDVQALLSTPACDAVGELRLSDCCRMPTAVAALLVLSSRSM